MIYHSQILNHFQIKHLLFSSICSAAQLDKVLGKIYKHNIYKIRDRLCENRVAALTQANKKTEEVILIQKQVTTNMTGPP